MEINWKELSSKKDIGNGKKNKEGTRKESSGWKTIGYNLWKELGIDWQGTYERNWDRKWNQRKKLNKLGRSCVVKEKNWKELSSKKDTGNGKKGGNWEGI